MNLYKLELMKIRLSTYLWAAFGIFTGLLALGILFLFIPQMEAGGSASEEIEMFTNWNGLLALITALAFACFSIFSAVIATKVIISEYCGKNTVILLSYPINRKTMFHIKCFIVSGITIVSAFISNTIVIISMYILAYIFGIMPEINTKYYFFTVLFSSFFMGILSSAVGMIATAFGWKKHSVVATIVCSLIIVCLLANWIAIFPNNMLWVILGMSMILVIIAGFVYHVLANRIEKMEV